MTLERPGGGKHPLKLDTRKYVGVTSETELAFQLSVKFLKSRGENNRTDIEFGDLYRPLYRFDDHTNPCPSVADRARSGPGSK